MNDDDQGSLFDPEEGRRRRDDGMARAEQGAGDWGDGPYEIGKRIMHPWTTDDLWQALHDAGYDTPREPRALGPVVMKLRRDGWIEPTGEYRPTDRPVGHRNPKKVWRPTLKAIIAARGNPA